MLRKASKPNEIKILYSTNLKTKIEDCWQLAILKPFKTWWSYKYKINLTEAGNCPCTYNFRDDKKYSLSSILPIIKNYYMYKKSAHGDEERTMFCDALFFEMRRRSKSLLTFRRSVSTSSLLHVEISSRASARDNFDIISHCVSGISTTISPIWHHPKNLYKIFLIVLSMKKTIANKKKMIWYTAKTAPTTSRRASRGSRLPTWK